MQALCLHPSEDTILPVDHTSSLPSKLSELASVHEKDAPLWNRLPHSRRSIRDSLFSLVGRVLLAVLRPEVSESSDHQSHLTESQRSSVLVESVFSALRSEIDKTLKSLSHANETSIRYDIFFFPFKNLPFHNFRNFYFYM